nr:MULTISPECIES: hypothetical protein [unclassified Pseudomonas]
MPDQAPKAAGSGTITATSGAKSAQTGTAFVGYISISKPYKSNSYIKNIYPTPRPMASIFEASNFHASPLAGFVLPSSPLQRHRRWLRFDFDDKPLARAFAHSAP